jgi:hypothetical protein
MKLHTERTTFSTYFFLHGLFRAQADWNFDFALGSFLRKALATYRENAAARPELLAHIVYFFR